MLLSSKSALPLEPASWKPHSGDFLVEFVLLSPSCSSFLTPKVTLNLIVLTLSLFLSTSFIELLNFFFFLTLCCLFGFPWYYVLFVIAWRDSDRKYLSNISWWRELKNEHYCFGLSKQAQLWLRQTWVFVGV